MRCKQDLSGAVLLAIFITETDGARLAVNRGLATFREDVKRVLLTSL